MIYGNDNCEKINDFTYVQKCPNDYVRVNHTNCMRDCSMHPQKIVLDYQCYNQHIEYLNDFEVFSSKEECNRLYEFCFEKKGSHNESEWLRDCPAHKSKVGFLCIPQCLNDMQEEIIQNLKDDQRYCIQDYVNTGLPFYDLN